MVVTPNMLGMPIKRGEDPRLVSGSGAYASISLASDFAGPFAVKSTISTM